jgi:hypothetical protein
MTLSAALLEAKPKRATRAKKAPSSGLTTAQRAWQKESAATCEQWIWQLRICDCKYLLSVLDLDGADEVQDKNGAIELLYSYFKSLETENQPSASAASSSSAAAAQIQAAAPADEVRRVPLSTHTHTSFILHFF